MNKIKPGINSPLICGKCGHRVGYVKLKKKVRWNTIKWAIGLGLAFEFISNLVVYLIFR